MNPPEIVTPDDARGMRTLREMLPKERMAAAAFVMMVCRRKLVVATGFPVGGRPETDGPPGAIALCRALSALQCGQGVALMSWREVLEACEPELPASVELLELPSQRIDAAVIAIECCGTTASGARLNMRREDISATAPCFEDATGDEILVAVGDGGNEAGMGAAPAEWFQRFGVVPPRSQAEVLVPASVSNWGALGIVATLGALAEADLLPQPDEHVALIERLVARGFVDGFTGECVARVDGRPLADEAEVVATLRAWVAERA